MYMPTIQESSLIKGVQTVTLQSYADERGRFTETFRNQWFPQVSWAKTQANRSDSHAGVIRGLHFHYQQYDYWFVLKGQLRAALFDIRTGSPTFGIGQTIDLEAEAMTGLLIPPGVIHGFSALSDVTMTYLVNNFYDASDEYGVLWSDPALKLDWGVTNPILSDRDQQNPLLSNISQEKRPTFAP